MQFITNPAHDYFGDRLKEFEKVVQKLKNMPSEQVLPAMVGLLKSGPYVRHRASRVLGEIGDKRAIGPLMEFLRTPYRYEGTPGYSDGGGGRTAAINALQKLAGKEAVPTLIEALEHPSWEVRKAAAETLGNLGDERAIDPLATLLPIYTLGEGDESRARQAAFSALQKIVGDEVLGWCMSRGTTHALVNCKCSSCGKTFHNWTHGKCLTCGIIHRHYCEFTDLHMAISPQADLNTIRELCRNGLVNVGDEQGFTPLMKASGKEGNLEILKLLVECGADINAQSVRGTTALSMAALHNKKDVAEYLTDRGAIVDFVVRRF